MGAYQHHRGDNERRERLQREAYSMETAYGAPRLPHINPPTTIPSHASRDSRAAVRILGVYVTILDWLSPLYTTR